MAVRAVFVVLSLSAAFGRELPELVRPTAAQADLAVPPEMVNLINNHPEHKATYVAGESEFFKGMSATDSRKLLGTRMEEVESPLPVKTYEHIPDDAIPAQFDARQEWPSYIHPIRNQLMCGSCWAFAASEALSDRFAIASKGKVDVVLSPEDMVSCDTTDMGCNGGILDNAWQYLKSTGIVTDTCFPYTAGTGVAPTCETSCVDSEPFKKYKASDAFRLTTVEDIQKAIMTDGPVEAGFMVHKSFMSYQSGVYQHHWWMFWDSIEGGHAVKIVGWGTDADSNEDYWLIANSWSESWGEKGYFKIKRGTNECQIENQVYAGHPAL
eukprot:CAMPEP_0183820322 /NCGR_PEP_ID=MMETSP0803_2-20130417/64584_1 /TAXON_ID=195967 /ORGANISM="Crustomastix stigmata, Strain CCMP3273" /LENGTH=324 /DNA_ID=CAMNT_0026065219 /DNA_START=32 /DNA_END=1006 /DNA_ORIENTATION=+